MGAVQAEQSVLDPVETEGEAYRRVLLTHLTSWGQEATNVVTDQDRCDSASLEEALNKVNGVAFEIEMETERKPLGLEAEQLLVAAELMMRRAKGYAGRGRGVVSARRGRCAAVRAGRLSRGGRRESVPRAAGRAKAVLRRRWTLIPGQRLRRPEVPEGRSGGGRRREPDNGLATARPGSGDERRADGGER